MATKSKRPTKKKSVPVPSNAPLVVVADNIPVITPGESGSTQVAIVATIANLVALLAAQYDVPLNEKNILILVAAVNVLIGVFQWARDRWFADKVTITSLPPATQKSLRRVSAPFGR